MPEMLSSASEFHSIEDREYNGILFVGDPHVSAFPPGHRLDDYPRTILGKLGFCLNLAKERGCLPIILGDLFHVPRNNPNFLLVDLIELFRETRPWVLVGNHDKYEARLTRDVSLSVLNAAGVMRLIDQPGKVDSICVKGAKVLVGASPDWTPIPGEVVREGHDFVIWVTHHDLVFPGYESGRYQLKEIPGVDLVVNGHIHTPKPSQRCGRTLWTNPGSIVRITRSHYTKAIKPAVALWTPEREDLEILEIPHNAFDEVFPPLEEMDDLQEEVLDESLFIKGDRKSVV